MKHSPVAPTTELTLGGEKYQLLFTFDAVDTAETVLDRPLLMGLSQRDIYTPKISTVRGLLYACMLHNRPDTTFDKVKALINQRNMSEVWNVVRNAWVLGMAEPAKDEDSTENPQKDPS